MKIMIFGGDGYLGWPTAMHFAAKGDEVCVVDNYLRRNMAAATDSLPLLQTPLLERRVQAFKDQFGKKIEAKIFDLMDYDQTLAVVKDFKPEAIIHYAEQPSAPYSMQGFKEAQQTMNNNLGVTFNCIWAVLEAAPDCHIVKLGTMGEYGTPNIDIEEGWIEIDHKGRKDKFLYPRAAGSLYHTTKVLDTDLLWFYVRTHNLRVTDLMQGPVYGLTTAQTGDNVDLLPSFHYDDIFGTVVNRFLVQAVSGIPLTVYGEGGQTRGYLNLKDTLQCVDLATQSPAQPGELRIFNQFTETFSVNELADKVREAAKSISLEVFVKKVENPRKEKEDHYYNPAHSGLTDLGLVPNFMTEDVIVEMLEFIREFRSQVDVNRVMPRVRWS